MANDETPIYLELTRMANKEPFMDIAILRFPQLAEEIFKELDNKSLAKCVKVSTLWSIFISMQKFKSQANLNVLFQV